MRWKYRDTVLTLCTLAFFATMVARLSISPVVPDITSEFEVSNTVMGVALSGLWMAYFFAQFPSGVFADRFGERPVILIAVGGTAAACLLLALSPLFAVFVVSTILLGLFAGLHYSVATTLLTRTYDNVGTAIGLHSTGGPVAGLITPLIVAWTAVQYGWRPAIAIGALVAIPVFVLFAWLVRPAPPRRPNTPVTDIFAFSSIRALLSRPPIAFTVCLAIASEFVWQATASFLPAFLVGHHGLSTTLAGLFFAFYFVVHGIIQVGVGTASDRFGRDFATAICMVAGILGYLILVVGSSIVSIAVGVFFVGFGMSWIAAILPRFVDQLSVEERGAGFGLVRTVYGMAGSVGSVAVGLSADVFNWGIAFTLLTVPLLFVVIALIANATLRWGY